MLKDVALKCSERLARPLNSPTSDVSDNFEREIREYSPVVHSDDTVFRFDFTLTEHQQLERIYHGHLFARNSARANLQQTKKKHKYVRNEAGVVWLHAGLTIAAGHERRQYLVSCDGVLGKNILPMGDDDRLSCYRSFD